MWVSIRYDWEVMPARVPTPARRPLLVEIARTTPETHDMLRRTEPVTSEASFAIALISMRILRGTKEWHEFGLIKSSIGFASGGTIVLGVIAGL